jgi:hypothetical protein
LVRERLNAQNIGCDTVVQSKREAGQNELPKVWLSGKPDLGSIEQKVYRAPNLGLKTFA